MDIITRDNLLSQIVQSIQENKSSKTIQFVNSNKVAKIYEDPSFGELMWKSDYVLTDGQPMIPMARMLGHKIPERIDGIGLMDSLLTLANSKKFSIYLLGANQAIVDSCTHIIRSRFPNIRIVGYRNGYFKSTEWHNIAEKIKASLEEKNIRVKFDNRDKFKPGYKFNEYELKGVPLRIAIGPKDLEKGTLEIARRDTLSKEYVSQSNIVSHISAQLELIQRDLFEKAQNFREENIREVNDFENFQKTIAAFL